MRISLGLGFGPCVIGTFSFKTLQFFYIDLGLVDLPLEGRQMEGLTF